MTLPDRAARIRIATDAEAAQTPAPNMRPPRLLGNTGELGEFVLPLNVPSAPARHRARRTLRRLHLRGRVMDADGARGAARARDAVRQDDRSRRLACPARVFAFNSTNVEGWGLYAEWMMLPYMPAEGQLISLQFRLLRAARAFLDPELHMGRVTPDEARRVLREDVVLSPAMTESEVERYMFRTPGAGDVVLLWLHAAAASCARRSRTVDGRAVQPARVPRLHPRAGTASADLLKEAVTKHFTAGGALTASSETFRPHNAPCRHERTEPMIPAPPDVAAPPADAETTPSGLATQGPGPRCRQAPPAANSRVRVHYTGWTTDGKMFDSSVARNEPITFGLNQVIAGWTEGVQLMVEGETRRLWIPEKLAYRGQPGAPKGMLVFDVELIRIES